MCFTKTLHQMGATNSCENNRAGTETGPSKRNSRRPTATTNGREGM